MSAPDKNQLLRLVFIDQKIREGMRTGRYANCATMAAEYEVSARSIQRDLDYLKHQRNAPIAYDASRKGYFYTEPSYALPALDLSASDLFAICIAEKVLRQHRGTPIHDRLASVLARIGEMLPERVTVAPAWIDSRITIHGGFRAQIVPEIWAAVAEALHRTVALRILYQKPAADGPVARVIEPYHLVNFQGEWYVIGRCRRRESVLTFAMSRIREASPTGETYAIPADFDFASLSGSRFGIIEGSGRHQVRIRFDRATAPYVLEREWHPAQRLTAESDGAVLLEFPSSHLLEVRQWVLAWGRGAEVLAPETLRNEVAAELAATLSIYRAPASA